MDITSQTTIRLLQANFQIRRVNDVLANTLTNFLMHMIVNTTYATPRGKLRLLALKQDFADCQSVMHTPINKASVLDIGGGQGQFSLTLAEQGAKVSLCDISDEMLKLARDQFAAANLPLTTQHCGHSLFVATDARVGCKTSMIEHHLPSLFQLIRGALQTDFRATQGRRGSIRCRKYQEMSQWRQIMNGRTHAPKESNPRFQQR